MLQGICPLQPIRASEKNVPRYVVGHEIYPTHLLQLEAQILSPKGEVLYAAPLYSPARPKKDCSS